MSSSICVIGAGVVGLSTALQILTDLPKCEVKVVADKFEEDTTSSGAAGIFNPIYSESYTKDRNRMNKWYNDSFHRYWDLIHSGENYAAGISLTPSYVFKKTLSQEDWNGMSKNVINLRALTSRDLTIMNLPKCYSSGYVCDSLVIEGRYLLPYLTEKIRQRGGSLEKRAIKSPHELSKEADIIVNCSGLGSRHLFNDDKMYPIRGQVIRVHAPWIKHMYMGVDNSTYIIPNRESVVIGGFYQKYNGNLNVEPEEITDILERTTQMVPSLKHASIIQHWVGLRPGRDGLRLELDMETCAVPVVHNYGHSAKGIALSHGTAVEATEIVKKVVYKSKL